MNFNSKDPNRSLRKYEPVQGRLWKKGKLFIQIVKNAFHKFHPIIGF
jgi:hypothetical protein